MDLTEALLAGLFALMATEIGTTHLRLARIERELANKPDRSELVDVKDELSKKADQATVMEILATKADQAAVLALPTREEFNAVRDDITGLRGEVTAMRGDLTQIALAVGAGRPRASGD